MPVRMYALAKELKLDSKDLVDICTKAGVPGKGSALASLSDDEAAKVKSYLSGGGASAKPKAKAKPLAPEKPSKPEKLSKPEMLTDPKPSRPKPSKPEPSKPEVAKPEPPKPEPPKPRPSKLEPSKPGPLRREDYVAPGGAGGKMPVLGDKSAKPAGDDSDKGDKLEGGEGRRPVPRTPAIHLAPLPAAEQPVKAAPKKDEPAPQKPIMTLPADAIQAHKKGSRPLAAHLRRVEEQNKDKQDKATGKGSGKRGKPAPGGPEEPAESPLRGRGRRGKKGGEPEEEKSEDGKKLLGTREQRQLNRKRSGNRRGGETEERRPRRARRIRRTGKDTSLPRKGKVTLEMPCTVRSFSEASGVAAAQILGILLREGTMGNVNSQIDAEMAEFIAEDLGVELEFREQVTLEDQLLTTIRDQEEDPDALETRPPVITFLGHVDHGKTSLLDRILGLDVVSGESGGITQHIRAYEVEKEGSKIAFVDTPGHEAFTEMRARGANVTDIAVLVVAADDGVMPQTEEAISHARAAEVPIVVALNKIDLPGVDETRAMQGLSANELLPVEWGGDVEVVRTSAMTGEGVDNLLDTLLTVAELHELKANPDRPAYGTCLEAHQETGRGVVTKMIVQTGTLRVGDTVVCGEAYGRVKAMYDTLHPDEKLEEAGPSVPVNLTGFDIAPEAGEHFYVMEDIAKAREIAERRAHVTRTSALGDTLPHVTLENLFERLGGEGEVSTLNIILRADVRGSIEAIQKELTKLHHEEVKVKVLQATVGGVTEADVHLADASDAIIIGFNVVPDEGARALADKRGVQIRRYEIIYKVTDDIRAALEGMLTPEEREVELGRALVQRTFSISRLGTIAGCRVLAGKIERNSRVRIIRNNTIIGDYPLGSLRREKDDAKEVREGMECGMRLEGFNDLKEADILEDYRVEEVSRKFDT